MNCVNSYAGALLACCCHGSVGLSGLVLKGNFV